MGQPKAAGLAGLLGPSGFRPRSGLTATRSAALGRSSAFFAQKEHLRPPDFYSFLGSAKKMLPKA
ncbi:hypothetical protein SGRA_0471 [Saprospira grandis str. Lewin]|uniref:Uncharacterized protein n=1 Tax=Saprospira grandis (strain Lewin) TaxID=984262 RepID=H6L9N2_SAPGL|nr:hypothetical protein SGRA_0471 [Saprospira grandis str. Lewin]